MKKEWTLAIVFWGIALLILFAISPIAGEENLYQSVIRIHVLANSDSPQDQEYKLLVRDRLLSYSQENFAQLDGKEEASEEICKRFDDMQRIAQDALLEAGCAMPVELSLMEEYYPTKRYESLSLPSGKYLSLQVKIGQAQGQNWWCVLFPPICLNTALDTEDALLEAGMKEENVKTVTVQKGKYKIRFKILEWWGRGKEKIAEIFS